MEVVTTLALPMDDYVLSSGTKPVKVCIRSQPCLPGQWAALHLQPATTLTQLARWRAESG
jgi:hypothetical protein